MTLSRRGLLGALAATAGLNTIPISMTHTNITETRTYKQGDERPAISSTLHDDDGNAVDLSDAQSVAFVLQARDEFEADSDTLALNTTDTTITDAANGDVEYVLEDGDLDVAAGRYYGAWRVSWPDQADDGFPDEQWFPREGLLGFDVERAPTGSVDPADAPQDLTVTRLTASEIAGSVADGNVIANLVGAGLSVDGNGDLNTIFEDTDGDGVYEQTSGSGLSIGDVFTDAVEVYVRSTGSDSNDGLTENTAKASIQAAITDSPSVPPGGVLTINVDEAATFTGEIDLEGAVSNINSVIIDGATDGNGNPATVIDANGDTNGLFAGAKYVLLRNLEFAPTASDRTIAVNQNASVKTLNCRIEGGDSGAVSIGSGGVLEDSADTEVVNTAAGATDVFNVTGELALQGSYTANGDEQAVAKVYAGGKVFVSETASFTGNDATYCFRVRDLGHVKTGEGGTAPTVDNFFRVAWVRRGAELSIDSSGLDTSNIDSSHPYTVERGGQLFYGPEDAVITSAGKVDDVEAVFGDQGNSNYGQEVFDSNDLLFKGWDGSGWLPFGVTEVASPTAGDLADRQAAFDTDNDRLLFKDSLGTVHVINTDSTL